MSHGGLHCRVSLTDPWLLQNVIPVAVIPAPQRLPLMDPEFLLAKAAEDFQGKLLAYRLEASCRAGPQINI